MPAAPLPLPEPVLAAEAPPEPELADDAATRRAIMFEAVGGLDDDALLEEAAGGCDLHGRHGERERDQRREDRLLHGFTPASQAARASFKVLIPQIFILVIF